MTSFLKKNLNLPPIVLRGAHLPRVRSLGGDSWANIAVFDA